MKTTLDRGRLATLGLEGDAVDIFIDRIEEMLAQAGDTALCWQELSAAMVAANFPFPVHEYLFDFLKSRRDAAEGPLPAWIPSLAVQHTSNIAAIIERLELAGYEALHAWSTANPEEYWGLMAEVCGIVFKQSYDRVADLTAGPTRPRWFPGAGLNIADSCFQAGGDETAIVFRRNGASPLETISYDELDRLSNRVAHGLRRLGLVPDDAIAVDMGMTVEAVAIYLGIVKAGCAVISIADSFTADEIATRLRIGEASAIFTTDTIERLGKRHPMYAKVAEADAPLAVVLHDPGQPPPALRDGDVAWQAFLSDDDSPVSVARQPQDVLNILFSSGTTGDPKAIPWDHTTPLKCAADGYMHQNIVPGEVICWPTNLGWMMGPWLIFATLINKAAIALFYDAPSTRDFTTFVQDAGVNVLGVVPSLVRAWRLAETISELDWSAVRAFSSTGECSNGSDMLYLMAGAGYKPIIEYCGGTEIGGAYLTSTVVQPNTPAAFSTPALGCDIVILDEEARPADEGEAFLVPPSIGLSLTLINQDHETVYYKRTPPGPEGRPLRRHGDRIQRLPDGYFRALGRADDTMNLGGIKVSSAEIERTLERLEPVTETAAIAVAPTEGGPGRLVIYAVTAADIAVEDLTAQMQSAIREKLNPLFKIHETVIVPNLPRTASGKVMRRELRRRYQDGQS